MLAASPVFCLFGDESSELLKWHLCNPSWDGTSKRQDLPQDSLFYRKPPRLRYFLHGSEAPSLAMEVHRRCFWQPGGLHNSDIARIAARGPQQLIKHDAARSAAVQQRRWVYGLSLARRLKPVGVCSTARQSDPHSRRVGLSSCRST